MEEKSKELKCRGCKKPIDLGFDLITVEKGVCGPRGVVPLGEMHVFCGEDCLRSFFDTTAIIEGYEFPERFPY